jgi:undecaprenyl-diphosphatase
MDKLIHLDQQITLAINSLNSPFFDVLMFNISKTFIWVPFYMLLMFFLWRQYGNKVIWIKILFLIILVFASDQSSVHLFKNVFERLRPCRDPDIGHLVHLVNGKCGGRFGFVSSHATNVFALATFLFFQMREKYKWIGWLFLWAAIVAYSRVYLGVHYLGDILGGAIWGSFVGYVVYRLEKYTTFLVSKKSSSK